MADEEPQPICANCDYFDRAGRPFDDPPWRSKCLHSKAGGVSVEMTDRCQKFFPDSTQWPDADHG
jgi:hypothetical protein